MTITVPAVVTNALRLCGQSQAPGRGITSEQQTEVTTFLNQMLNGWNAMRNAMYTVGINRYTLDPPQLYYTIGPSGADFTAPRPIRILNANLILTGQTPEVRVSLVILNDDQWAEISVKDIPTTVPVALYNDGASPNSKLYLWGYPTQNNDLELFTPSGLSDDLTDSDTLELPEGYARAITYNLAMEIAPLYWQKTDKLLAQVQKLARESRAAIKSMNSEAPLIMNDSAFLQSGPPRPYFNWKTGM